MCFILKRFMIKNVYNLGSFKNASLLLCFFNAKSPQMRHNGITEQKKAGSAKNS